MEQPLDQLADRDFDETHLHEASKEAIWWRNLTDEQIEYLIGQIRKRIVCDLESGLLFHLEHTLHRYVVESNLRERSEWWPLAKGLKSQPGSRPKLTTRASRYFEVAIKTLTDAEVCFRNLSQDAWIEFEKHIVERETWSGPDRLSYGRFKGVWRPAKKHLNLIRDASRSALRARHDQSDALGRELTESVFALDEVLALFRSAPFGMRRTLDETCRRIGRADLDRRCALPTNSTGFSVAVFWLACLKEVMRFPLFDVRRARDEAALRRAVESLTVFYHKLTGERPRRSCIDAAIRQEDRPAEASDFLDFTDAFFRIAKERGAKVPENRKRIGSKIAREVSANMALED